MTQEQSNGTHAFQAEVRQLLDIVIHSLYTDREIFLRELVSNASDALEKMRLVQLTESGIFEAAEPLEIRITTDETAGTLTIADTGIGMSREELVQNLGTIAHSGTKAFLQSLAEDKRKDASVIGQFGVGFYSAFMVAKEVEVYTHSWREDGEHLRWSSKAEGSYEIEEAPGQKRGCRIVIHLKDDAKEFCQPYQVKEVLRKYSSFISFPVYVNGDRVNTVEPLWMKSRSEITEEQYKEFYQFTAHAFDEPGYRFHFQTDAPIAMNALLFTPPENQEALHMGPYQPSVALYCKRVLIDPHPEKLLPDWMRFLKGVIDSEDLPLNISRESMQDSALLRKIKDVIVKRFLKFLATEAESDSEKYAKFHGEFGRFLKEGIITDHTHKDALANLLRFSSTMTEEGQLTSLADYRSRMKEEQKSIYYQIAPDRNTIEAGPYLEGFRKRGLEVLFFIDPVDDYLVGHLGEFDGIPLEAVDHSALELPEMEGEEEPLSTEEMEGLGQWMKEVLGDSVKEVRPGKRLVESPAMILTERDSISPQIRRMMKSMNQEVPPEPSPVLELNPSHALVKELARARQIDPALAGIVAEQLRDTALLGAGQLEDATGLLKRSQIILTKALSGVA